MDDGISLCISDKANTGMTPTMPRFNIRNLLVGTAWFAVWAALLTFYMGVDYPALLLPIHLVATFIIPFVAIGSLLGNAMKGLKLGISSLVILFALSHLIVVVGALFT